MHSAASFVVVSALLMALGSATSVFLGPHTLFATPTHTPLLSYRLEVPFANPTAAARATILPTQASGAFLYFAEGPRAQHQFALESTRYREQAPQGYVRTSQQLQAPTQSPVSFAPEARVSSQDFPVSPQRQDYPTSRTPENNVVQNQNFAGRSSVQEFPVEDRRTQLSYPARPSQNFQEGRSQQAVPESRRVQQPYPEPQAAYPRGPTPQSYPEGRRVNEDFPYPETRYPATPTPVAYSSVASSGYTLRPTARTFPENSQAQEYPVQAYPEPQAYTRTSVAPQGYSGEQFQEEVPVRQQFPEARVLPAPRGYVPTRPELHHPQTYSVNFEGSGFGYGYTVQRQQATTPTPSHFVHAN